MSASRAWRSSGTPGQAVCPYCGDPNEDIWEYALLDGQPETVECEECGRPMEVLLHTIREYETRPAEETDEDEDA